MRACKLKFFYAIVKKRAAQSSYLNFITHYTSDGMFRKTYASSFINVKTLKLNNWNLIFISDNFIPGLG